MPRSCKRAHRVLIGLALLVGVTLQAAPVVVFSETFFTAGGNEDLAGRTPFPTGTSWTELEDTTSGITVQAHSGDYAVASTGFSGARIVYTGTTNPALGSADYDVEVKINQLGTSGAADLDPMFIVGRVASATSYYGVGLDTDTQQQLFLFVRTGAGTTVTLLGGGKINSSVAAPNIITLSMRGNTIRALVDDISLICAVDNTISAAGTGGVGFGVTTDALSDISNVWRLDDFIITDQTGEGGDDDCGAGGGATHKRMMLLGVGE